MRGSRQAIADALFALLSAVTWTYGSKTYVFVTKTQKPTLPENVTPTQQPYLGVEFYDEDQDQQEAIAATHYVLHFKVYIYARADADPDIPGEKFLTAILTAVDNAMQNQLQPGERQTLSNTVYRAWIEGNLMRSNGLVDQQMFLVVPVNCETGI